MSTTLKNIRLSASLALTLEEARAGVTAKAPASWSYGETLSHGTGAGKADTHAREVARTLGSGLTRDLDLYDLANFAVATDPLGNAVANAELVAIAIKNHADSAGTLLVGGNGTAAAFNSIFAGSDDAKLAIPPKGFVVLACTLAAAWAIADTSNHLLRLEASGGDVTYTLELIGRTA